MAIATRDYLASLERHGRATALAAPRGLDRAVEHCPGWTVRTLVEHLVQVHWFWATIVEGQLEEPPTGPRPDTPAPEDLLITFDTGLERLIRVLGGADQAAPVWTWAPRQRDVAFVTRHQVQEMMVHHWDAAHAVGSPYSLDPDVASDAVEEFLTFSAASDDDPATPPHEALGGRFGIRCRDTGAAWTIEDGRIPGALTVRAGVESPDPCVTATAGQLLLWLYGRAVVPLADVDAGVLARFRRLCTTD